MKNIFYYILLTALIFLELFLILNSEFSIGYEMIEFWNKLWLSSKPILIFLIVPVLIIAMLAKLLYNCFSRMGWGVKPKLRIRSFDTVLQDSKFNGKAATILLYKELSDYISQEKEKGKAGKTIKTESKTSDLKRQAPTINLVGTTLSFEWIKAKVRKFIGITDFEIKGLIDDSTNNIKITAWAPDHLRDSENFNGHWEESIDDVDQDDSFRMAIVSLARKIAEEIAPNAAVNLYWRQSRYEEALYMLSFQFKKKEFRTIENHSNLAWLYYESDFYKEAIEEFEKVQQLLGSRLLRFFKIRNPFLDDSHRGLALAHASLGRYDESIEILKNQLKIKETPRILIELGTTHLLKRNDEVSYKKALSIYERAEQRLIKDLHKEFNRAVSLQSTQAFITKFSAQLNEDINQFSEYYDKFLDSLHRIGELKNKEKVSGILQDLADLYGLRGRCLYTHQDLEEAKRYFEKAILVLQVHSYVDPYLFEKSYLSTGFEDLAQCYESVDNYKEAEKWYKEASFNYESEISFYKEDIELETTDITSLTSLTKLGWAYCGQYSSLLNLVRIEEMVLDEKYEYPTYLHSIIEELVKLVEIIPKKNREKWIFAVKDINKYSKETYEHSAALSEASNLFINALFNDRTEEQINKPFDVAESVEIGEERSKKEDDLSTLLNEAFSAGINNKTVRRILESMDFSEEGRKTEFSTRMQRMFSVVATLAQSVESSDISNVCQIAIDIIKRDESYKLASEIFLKLQKHKEIHHQAEANFGGACLCSISGDIQGAVELLQDAIEITTPPGSKSSEYRNRAKLDSDFNPIRFSEEFQQLIHHR